ncbi:MAG TPA: hypothetical protein DEF61_02525 [Firmicutes bacterium]|nr:hypothetical protein [Bacillota bacterium]
MNFFLRIAKLSKKYKTESIFIDASWNLPRKGMFGLTGPSGCGKSTLLRIIAGLDGDFTGSVLVNNYSLKGMDENSRRDYRSSNIGLILQDYPLLNQETSLVNSTLLLECLSNEKKEIKQQKGFNLLNLFSLKGLANKKVKHLSGGQKQRVAGSISLSNSPFLILADEPTASLDENSAKKVFKILKDYSKRCLVIVSSHDLKLLQTSCDSIFKIEERKIKEVISYQNVEDLKTPFNFYLPKRKEKPSMPFLTRLRIAFNDLISKKLRFTLAFSSCFLSLCLAGFSSYVKYGMSKEIQKSLSSFCLPYQLVVNKKQIQEKKLFPCPPNRIEEVYSSYRQEIRSFGYHLNFDFSSLFKDDDSIYLLTKYKTIPLPYYSSRHINEFMWFEEKDFACFPDDIENVNDDEVILGLPFDYMSSLCLELGIERSFPSLGNYLFSNKVNLLLNVENDDIGFDNQELFTIKGVINTSLPCLFNSSSTWNKTIFIDHMQFRPSNEEENENLQYVYQIPYLYLENEERFYSKIKNDSLFNDLSFDPKSNTFLTSTCDSSFCLTSRVYVYKSNHSNAFAGDCLNLIDSFPCGYLPIQTNGFYADTSSIFSGFLPQFYLSSSYEDIKYVSESISSLPIEQAMLPLELSDKVYSGSLLSGLENKIKFSSLPKLLEKGDFPISLNEIVLSNGLFDKLGKPSSIYCSYEISSSSDKSKYYRNMSINVLKVSGVTSSEDLIFYAPPSFFEDYFFSSFKVCSSNLEKTGVVLFFNNQNDLIKGKELLEKNIEGYSFLDVDSFIALSMEETTTYIGTLLLFSTVAILFLSILLFCFVSIVNYEDDFSNRRFFLLLGLAKKENFYFYFFKCLILIFLSGFLSLLLMVPMTLFANFIISSSFSSKLSFSISCVPFLSILICMAIYVLISFALAKRGERE